MRWTAQRIALFGLLAAAACGGSDPAAPGQPAEPDPVVDPALTGAWNGTIRGGGGGMSGSANIRFELDATGIMRASVSNLPFHEIPTGTWGVVDGEFRATGQDTEGGTVSFAAPRSATHMEGTWEVGIFGGTFDITKE